jgi:16S rRNA processing protein RimM
MDLTVGWVVKAHGTTGELVVAPRTDAPDERFAPGAVLALAPVNGPRRAVTVHSSRPHQARLLVRFREVADRAAADTLRGAGLLLDSADLPPTGDPEEFHDHDLEGLAARTVEGAAVGVVSGVRHGHGPDLLAIDTGDGEALVPFVHQIVPAVDLAAGTLVIDPPDGLLET